ncbi:mitotic checkpoint regulator, MAD2B-interacting-domain-containing protein [Cokeromyces recurvatus]|uniref:mitotic checkpoint regulator, MAD2B-interacting-domain-containing protein n=1 Tax=Cokeromyces recurvatus TaxID=90255 RepID=UPI00221EE293|nr:mitotic checkpoint regulator, MAD2B-interacting-domain-containing protein [Cokeromyces recurvatus]KAI7901523.1 mitotic checkpoint regulator, MAD2B-interacting-domain-containing protein [Cokeromyces recurvatus]
MSLVPNYASSSDSDESDNESKPQQKIETRTKKTLSSLLPQPKKTVYIDLPKIKDDNEEEEEIERKPIRNKTTAGLGLADLLPAPKNRAISVPVTKTTTDKAFTPHSLAKRLKEKNQAIREKLEKKEENKDETSKYDDIETNNEEDELVENQKEEAIKKYTGPFFRVGKDLKEEQPIKKPVQKHTDIPIGPIYTAEKPPEPEEPELTAVDAYAYDPNAIYSADPSLYYQYQQQTHEQDDINLEQYIGKRARGETSVQIKTINQQDILPSEDWRATQALTAAPKFYTGAPMQASKLQMKKNNIVALAAHAVNNQERLDEMFAANKRTRREAARKYGF